MCGECQEKMKNASSRKLARTDVIKGSVWIELIFTETENTVAK